MKEQELWRLVPEELCRTLLAEDDAALHEEMIRDGDVCPDFSPFLAEGTVSKEDLELVRSMAGKPMDEVCGPPMTPENVPDDDILQHRNAVAREWLNFLRNTLHLGSRCEDGVGDMYLTDALLPLPEYAPALLRKICFPSWEDFIPHTLSGLFSKKSLARLLRAFTDEVKNELDRHNGVLRLSDDLVLRKEDCRYRVGFDKKDNIL
jgi:hypothetical protein